MLLATDLFSSHMTVEQLKVIIRATYKSSFAVCLITGRRCGQQYMGETGKLLHCKINSHPFDIMHWITKNSPMVAHFDSNASLSGRYDCYGH